MRNDSGDYVDFEAVEKELLWARRLCNAHGWPTIDVTRRSIEETSATVLKLMEAWHIKHPRPVRA
jgi:regulator of PEP synthase PpsR (kinase-PPPase family)